MLLQYKVQYKVFIPYKSVRSFLRKLHTDKSVKFNDYEASFVYTPEMQSGSELYLVFETRSDEDVGLILNILPNGTKIVTMSGGEWYIKKIGKWITLKV